MMDAVAKSLVAKNPPAVAIVTGPPAAMTDASRTVDATDPAMASPQSAPPAPSWQDAISS